MTVRIVLITSAVGLMGFASPAAAAVAGARLSAQSAPPVASNSPIASSSPAANGAAAASFSRVPPGQVTNTKNCGKGSNTATGSGNGDSNIGNCPASP